MNNLSGWNAVCKIFTPCLSLCSELCGYQSYCRRYKQKQIIQHCVHIKGWPVMTSEDSFLRRSNGVRILSCQQHLWTSHASECHRKHWVQPRNVTQNTRNHSDNRRHGSETDFCFSDDVATSNFIVFQFHPLQDGET